MRLSRWRWLFLMRSMSWRWRSVIGRNERVFEPERFAAFHHALELRANHRPDVGPEFAPGGAESKPVALGAQTRGERVVVDHDEVRPPEEEHRIARRQQRAGERLQALEPVPLVTNGRRRQVE